MCDKALDHDSWIDYQVAQFCDRHRAWVHIQKEGIFGEIGYHKKNKVYCLFGTSKHKQYHEFSLEQLKNAPKNHEIGIVKDLKWYVSAKFETPSEGEKENEDSMLCEMAIHLRKETSDDDRVHIHQITVREKNGHLLRGTHRYF